MQMYLYTGADRAQDVTRLALGVAGMNLPVCIAYFGPVTPQHHLALLADALPIDFIPVRLPGLGRPRSNPQADTLTTETTTALLRQMIAGGSYRLFVLDNVREALARRLLTVEDLHHLVRAAPADTQIAMT
ncbi:MAG TPA: hypothetical protein ENJ31_01420 [Anaerolineae bacterium]|nr:hypothetical protein [Anaerolineae bacterium]